MKKTTKKKPQNNGLEFYKSGHEYRWAIYRKGRIIGASTEGYKNLSGARSNCRSVYLSLLGVNFRNPIEDAISAYKAKRKKK